MNERNERIAVLAAAIAALLAEQEGAEAGSTGVAWSRAADRTWGWNPRRAGGAWRLAARVEQQGTSWPGNG